MFYVLRHRFIQFLALFIQVVKVGPTLQIWAVDESHAEGLSKVSVHAQVDHFKSFELRELFFFLPLVI
jgi:hypothetical protein